MVKLNVKYGEFMHSEWQVKTFRDEYVAMEWCRRNYKKIQCINDYRTFYQPISHFDVMSAIEGVCN